MKLPKFSSTFYVLIIAEMFTSILVILYFNFSVPKQINNVPVISPSPTSSEWLTYKNEKYGFEFQYSEVLKLNTGDNQILLTNSRGDGGALNIYPNISDNILKFELLNSQNCQRSVNESGEGCQQVLVDTKGQPLPQVKQKYLQNIGLTFYHLNAPSIIDMDFYWWKKDQTIYILSIPSSWTMSDQILSTFKFMPDTSTWKTYKNEKYGFEFQYPSEYSLNINELQTRINLYSPKDKTIGLKIVNKNNMILEAFYKFLPTLCETDDDFCDTEQPFPYSSNNGQLSPYYRLISSNQFGQTLISTIDPFFKLHAFSYRENIYQFIVSQETPEKDFNQILSSFKFTQP